MMTAHQMHRADEIPARFQRMQPLLFADGDELRRRKCPIDIP